MLRSGIFFILSLISNTFYRWISNGNVYRDQTVASKFRLLGDKILFPNWTTITIEFKYSDRSATYYARQYIVNYASMWSQTKTSSLNLHWQTRQSCFITKTSSRKRLFVCNFYYKERDMFDLVFIVRIALL